MESLMKFDDIFEEIGGGGVFQVVLFALVCMVAFTAIELVWINFTGYVDDHWCHVTELEDFPFSIQQNVAIPLDSNGVYQKCQMFDLNYSSYTYEDFLHWNGSMVANATTIMCNDGWVYNRSVFVDTLTMQYDLVCGKRWLVDFITTVMTGGAFIGAYTAGVLADKYGRKTALMFCIICKISGNLLSFIPDFYAYLLSRFMNGYGSISSYQIAVVILTEFMGRDYRNIAGVGFAVIYSLGFTSLPLIANFIRDYMKYHYALTVPTFVMLIYPILLPESPRWLLLQGRHNECKDVLKRIAAINGRSYPETLDLEKVEITNENEHENGSLMDLIRTPRMRQRTLILFVAWFTVSLIFYALSLNAGNLAGGLFVNTFLLGLVEIPANLLMIFMMNRKLTGRRYSHVGAVLIAGTGCLIVIPIMLVGTAPQALSTAFSLIGKAGATATFNGLYLYSAELFPTQVRNIGVGASNAWARIGAMVSSYFGGYLFDVWSPLPSLIFGVLGTAVGFLMLFLPETLGKDLPQTVDDVEDKLVKSHSTTNLLDSDLSLSTQVTNYGSTANTISET